MRGRPLPLLLPPHEGALSQRWDNLKEAQAAMPAAAPPAAATAIFRVQLRWRCGGSHRCWCQHLLSHRALPPSAVIAPPAGELSPLRWQRKLPPVAAQPWA